jgi:WD40 repeat protein
VLLGCAALLIAGLAQAIPLNTALSRLEVGAHTGVVREFAVDEGRGIVASVADDKTLRIWDISDGYLYRTYRVPLGPAHVGKLFGLALHPRKPTVAVAGWTNSRAANEIALFLVNLDSGEIENVLDGLPDIVSTLRFSRDGKRLCIAFATLRKGLQCHRYPSMEPVFSDFGYQAQVRRLQMLADGGIIAVAGSGEVVRYRRDGTRVAEVSLADPGVAASSALGPNGKLLAVGYLDAPAVRLLDARTLEEVALHRLPMQRQRNLPGVAFSGDGKTLYAAGDGGGQNGAVFAWPVAGTKSPGYEIPIPTQLRVTWLEEVDGGDLLVATEEPGLLRIARSGTLRYHRQAPLQDFSSRSQLLKVSDDGLHIRFPGSAQEFDVRRRELRRSSAPTLLYSPQQSSAGLQLAGWRDSTDVTLNGVTLARSARELNRSFAYLHDGRGLILGGEWSLARYDRSGALQWHRALTSIAWQVNVAPSGELLVAALSDGTIRWYRTVDGSEVAALFVHAVDGEWVLWSADGYYASSPSGDRYLGWHINTSPSSTRFFRAVQFERIFYRPDIVQERFRAALTGVAPPALEAPDLLALMPPRIALMQPPWESPKIRAGAAELEIAWEVPDPAGSEYNVFVNDIPVLPRTERAVPSATGKRLVSVPLLYEDNNVRIEVITENALAAVSSRVQAPASAVVRGESTKRRLFLISIGVSGFENFPKDLQLRFAANDALAFERLATRELREHFDEIHVRTLSDFSLDLPTGQNVTRALDILSQSSANDTVVLFLASHGLSNDRGDYYFVPRDAALEDLDRIYTDPGAVSSLVPWTRFVDAMRDASGYRYLIVDTCHAERIGGDLELVSLAKRSSASSFALLAAARGPEESQELPSKQHGLFTYGFLEALDFSSDRRPSMEEAFAEASTFVVEARPNKAKPQNPQLTAPESLREYRLVPH